MPTSSQRAGSSISAIHAPGSITALDHVPKERQHFRALLLANPNYFGHLTASVYAPVLAIKGNTTYEELKCVGFHPQSKRLDAVIFVNQNSGYGGNVCTAGSTEYVRFYLSFDNGASWVDQGVSSFTVYDVPTNAVTGHRLEYATSIACSPPQKWCTVPNLILARAILSWNEIPPPNTPDYLPVWGNRHDTHIQVDPVWFIKWFDLLQLADIKLKPVLAQSFDVDSTVSVATKKALTLPELKELYQGKGVEAHRFAMADIKKLISTPEAAPYLQADLASALAESKLSEVISSLLNTDSSTVYEELDCVGLKPDGFANELVAVLRIKRSTGFSGGPCTQGSREYVTFWADFDNNGTFETCVGTASVQVYDLDVPAGGVEYSVSLPVNLNPYRRQCGEGPRVVPIRAILSWNQAPPCGNPDWVPTWGNREETLILIPPGMPIVAGDFTPYLYDISYTAVCLIDQTTGLAAGARPFGGTLCITGEIPGALDLVAAGQIEYQLWASQGALVVPIVAPFSVTVDEGSGSTVTSQPLSQVATAEYFSYLEYGTPALGSWRRVSSPNRLLGYWNTAGLSGMWAIQIQARRVGTLAPIYSAGTKLCLPVGTPISSVNVTLDQIPPVCGVAITGYTDAMGFHPAAKCGDFPVGATIVGTFDVTDNMGVGSFGLALEPQPAVGVPVSVVVDAASTVTHRFGTWSVNTSTLEPCGYIVQLTASDRTIADCTSVWTCHMEVGLCLRTLAPSAG